MHRIADGYAEKVVTSMYHPERTRGWYFMKFLDLLGKPAAGLNDNEKRRLFILYGAELGERVDRKYAEKFQKLYL